MKSRRPGLQRKWTHVVNSLQRIIPSYEKASTRISLYADMRMRREAVDFVVGGSFRVLDLGAGPGIMARLVASSGAEPVLLDVSKAMLLASDFLDKVQATFENLPFRNEVFDGSVSGFALRDSYDLGQAFGEMSRVIKKGGKMGLCDLGKPDSVLGMMVIGAYLRIVPNLVGLVSAGRAGLAYGSIYDTYVLSPHNSELVAMLSKLFSKIQIHETQFGGAIVVKCSK